MHISDTAGEHDKQHNIMSGNSSCLLMMAFVVCLSKVTFLEYIHSLYLAATLRFHVRVYHQSGCALSIYFLFVCCGINLRGPVQGVPLPFT